MRRNDLALSNHLHHYTFRGNVGGAGWLLGGFLGLDDGATLVLAALGAGAMRELLFVAIRTLRKASGSEEVVSTAIGGAARRVAPFRIRHDAIPFVFVAGQVTQDRTVPFRRGQNSGA